MLARGESVVVDDYTVTFTELVQDGNVGDIKLRATATLEIREDGELIGIMLPEKRIYKNYERQQFAEVSTIPGLGDELYATLLGLTEDDMASFKVSVNPLVNWIWIGGTLMCVVAFLLLRRMPRPGEGR